ncbi:MAG: TldD/PmbA family protein [Solobacterium sp.]|nr:TldD/PmbA family protein [Solobacterium sp.]
MNKQAWIDYALKEGFESFEIYESSSMERTLSWFEGQRDSFVTSKVTGFSLRGIINGKMANMALENDDDSLMENVIRSMKEQAEAITAEDVSVIRHPVEAVSSPKADTWVKPEIPEILDTMKKLEEKLLAYDPRIIQVATIEWNEQTVIREIVNSYGMNIHDENVVQVIFAEAAAKEGNDIKNDYHVEVVHDLSQLDQDAFVKELADSVLYKLNATSLKSNTYPVIFESKAMTELFGALSAMFSGELVSKGISPVKASFIGEKIFADCITIIDDPANPEALIRMAYDDEGCPTSRKTLVENGVLKMILHDSKSALRMETESTGNGFKRSYASAVDVSPMNCCIQKGDKSLDELCAQMKDGLVITSLQGLHAGIRFITTDFSLQCSGYWVKDGKKDHSVTLITVAANFIELMKNAYAVGNDLNWKHHSIVCPSIAFKGCAVSGE